jgi:hypothetical protein
MGKYESLQTEAALANLASRDSAALAYAQDRQSHDATPTAWHPPRPDGCHCLDSGRPYWRVWERGLSAVPGC